MSETVILLESTERAAPTAAGAMPYYLVDFMTVIDGVCARYADLLNAEERQHLAKLAALTPAARMLYARLVNRRGPYFRVAGLDYQEIGNVEAAVQELADAALLQRCADQHAREFLLACFTYPELKAALREHKPVRTCRRPELLAWIAEWEGYGAWVAALLTRHSVICLPPSDPFAFLRFLFFGELRQNLSDFVTRALGHIVTETVEAAALRPLFSTREEMDDAYRMAALYQEFRNIRESQSATVILEWWKGEKIHREDLNAGQDWFDRLVNRLGQLLERANETDAAAALYVTSPVAPARERRARLLIKSGDAAGATDLLREILNSPCHAQEAYAARQLLARLERRSRRTEARELERGGATLLLDYPQSGVEQAVLAHYRQQGWQGVHSENWLWNASFGLLLWDVIYDPSLGVFHSPFQFAPSDLHQPHFYARRQPRIEARLAMLAEPASAFAIMREHSRTKTGIANPFVAWHDDLLDVLSVMVQRLPGAGHAAALRYLARNIARHSSGLPDLFLWNENDYRFVEIKAENDHLSGHQFEWLRLLEEAGIKVSLEKVKRKLSTSF